jgi:hypothetical protein
VGVSVWRWCAQTHFTVVDIGNNPAATKDLIAAIVVKLQDQQAEVKAASVQAVVRFAEQR